MKTRKTIATFEAKETQEQINRTKHERGRKLLESKLKTTYLESYVDLQEKKAVIICNRNYVSDKVKEELTDMAKSAMDTYQIEKVDGYGYNAFLETFKNKEFPKSTIIRPEINGSNNNNNNNNNNNQIPSIMVDGIDEIHCDKNTKKDVQTLYDLRDNALQKLGFEPTLITSGNEEAGEIRIIIEASGLKWE